MFSPAAVLLLPLVPVLVASWLTTPAAAAPAGRAPTRDAIQVPGAELQRVECHDDLSATALAAKGRSDISDWAGLHSKKTVNPPAGAGIQIDGYFPDDSTTNTTYGWNHDSQFVIRLPENWNGQLVITGAPGVRKQYAPDYILSDWMLSQGYAYASTDKGNTGTSFYENGSRSAPGQAMREWHDRVSELTVAAKEVVAQRYGSRPARTWMTGISNGGYLTRWQLENRPELFDGGVDWEGTLMTRRGPQPLHLPADGAARVPAGARSTRRPGSGCTTSASSPARRSCGTTTTPSTGTSPSAPTARRSTRPTTARPRRARRSAAPARPGTPTACDADYDYASRPQAVKDAVASVSLTGKIRKPMLTLHGNLDALLPIDATPTSTPR